jgi:hypothetical protein
MDRVPGSRTFLTADAATARFEHDERRSIGDMAAFSADSPQFADP